MLRSAMKKWADGGRENTEEATQCGGCGTNGFICWEKVEVPNHPKHLFFRVSVAACMGVAVSALALYVSWLNTRDAEGLRPQQFYTQHTLRDLDRQIINYQKQFGAPPRELKDLYEKQQSQSDEFLVFDGWK